MDQSEDEQEEEEHEHIDLVHDAPIKGRGIAATLALLKGTKDLTRKEELVGRTKDERQKVDINTGEGREIQLEYRDDMGRKLTTKEAYRQLCYNFHGYGPGKAKTEKRIKAVEAKNKAATRSVDAVGTMKSFTKAQEATGKSHITIEVNRIDQSDATFNFF
jgi:U4/U6.U5 tri-snRNP-associated protein 1